MQLQQAQQQLAEARQLNQQLEADVLALTSSSGAAGAAAGTAQQQLPQQLAVSGSSSAVRPGEPLGTPGRLGDDGLARLVSVPSDGAAAAVAAAGPAGNSGAEPSGALLAAVTAQRERYRSRLAQLEGELAAGAAALAAAQADGAALRRDNVALVEKVRFLER